MTWLRPLMQPIQCCNGSTGGGGAAETMTTSSSSDDNDTTSGPRSDPESNKRSITSDDIMKATEPQ